MNVLELLEENNITFSLEYYGINDFATGWEIKSVVEQADFYRDLFSIENTLAHMNYEKYLFYLFSKKICCMKELIPTLIDEDAKITIQELITYADNFVTTISNGELIKYINIDYKTIFDEDGNVDVKHITLDLIVQFSSGISDEVYCFLAENYGYFLIDKYSDFEKIFEEKPWIFEKTIPSGSYSEVMTYRYENVLNIYAHIKSKGNSSLSEIADERIDKLYVEMLELSKKLDDESIIREEHRVRLFAQFLEKIKHLKAPEFEIINKKVEELLTDYLNRKGQVFSYKIPVEEILKKWNIQKYWEIKLLLLTHDTKVHNERYIVQSRLNNHIESKASLMDMLSSNIVTDSFFTYSHQQTLSILESIETGTMMGVFSRDEMLKDYFNMLGSALHFIEGKIQLEEDALIYDFEIMTNMLSNIKVNFSSSEGILTPLCYSVSVFMCGFLEKILRMTYEYEARGKQYFLTDRATLGQLLNEKNTYIVNIFGVEHIRNLMFYLGTVGEKQIGYNIRNSLAHLTGNIEKQLTIEFVAKIMWIFTDVVNTIFGFYLVEYLKGGKDD